MPAGGGPVETLACLRGEYGERAELDSVTVAKIAL